MLPIVRIVAAALSVALSSGPLALCSGWQATPEARMACCVEGLACAMHPSENQDGPERPRVTQADADNCCAASEQDDASPTTTSPAALVVPPATTASIVLLPLVDPQSAAWDRRAPDRTFAVSRNVLLSVFII